MVVELKKMGVCNIFSVKYCHVNFLSGSSSSQWEKYYNDIIQ